MPDAFRIVIASISIVLLIAIAVLDQEQHSCTFTVTGYAYIEGVSDQPSLVIEAWPRGESWDASATCATGSDGTFILGPIEHVGKGAHHAIVAWMPGYSSDSVWVSEPSSCSNPEISVRPLILHSQKQVAFEWIWQPNGTRLFDSDLPRGIASLSSSVSGESEHCGFTFASGTVSDPRADIYFSDSEEHPHGFWANNGSGGVVDMGPVSLNEVVEAPAKGYRAQWTPLAVGHTYCVLSRDGKTYAKLRVTELK